MLQIDYKFRLLSAAITLVTFLILFLLTQVAVAENAHIPEAHMENSEEVMLMEEIAQDLSVPDQLNQSIDIYDQYDNLVGSFVVEELDEAQMQELNQLLDQSDLLIKTSHTAIYKMNS